jgi:predicted AAA+ superfamily ATPase
MGSPEMGDAFETYMAHELKTYADYTRSGPLCYWRSKSGFEVDFVLGNALAVEVKAKRVVSDRDLRGLRALREETRFAHYVVACLEQVPRVADGIEVLPWRNFLARLWGRALDGTS